MIVIFKELVKAIHLERLEPTANPQIILYVSHISMEGPTWDTSKCTSYPSATEHEIPERHSSQKTNFASTFFDSSTSYSIADAIPQCDQVALSNYGILTCKSAL